MKPGREGVLQHADMRNIVVVGSLFVGACGGSQTAPDAPTTTETNSASEQPASPAGTPASPAGDAPARPKLTAQECEAGGGTVVGDIGDGAVHRPDYRCASGAAPSGSIVAAEDGPIAVEGSVCCPK